MERERERRRRRREGRIDEREEREVTKKEGEELHSWWLQ